MAQYFGPPLHRGSVRQLLAGQTSIHPVLQVVDVKQIGSAGAPGSTTNERFRLMLSDGEHYQQAMLATQLNELVKNNEVRKFSVVQVDECVRPPVALPPATRRTPRHVRAPRLSALAPRVQVHLQHGAEPQVRAPRRQATFGSRPRARSLRLRLTLAGPPRIVIVLRMQVVGMHGETLGAPKSLDAQAGGGAEGTAAAPAYAPPAAPPAANYGQPAGGGYGGGGYGQQGGAAGGYGAPGGGQQQQQAPAYGAPAGGYGAPQPNNAYGGGYGGGQPAAQQGAYGAPQQAYNQPAQAAQPLAPRYGQQGAPVARNDMPTHTSGIASLNPYQSRWTLKIRVTAKSDIKRFTNAKGEGKLCSFDIIDEVRTCAHAVPGVSPNHIAPSCATLGWRADSHGNVQRRRGQVLRADAGWKRVPGEQGHSEGCIEAVHALQG